MTKLTKTIIKELKDAVDSTYTLERFFKIPINYLGVRSSDVWDIAKRNYPKALNKGDLITTCKELLESGVYEYSLVAFRFVYIGREKFDQKDFPLFEAWLHKYVTNWGLCDTFVPHTLSDLLWRYPSLMPKVRKWTQSKNTMVRRASAVVLLRDSGGAKPTLHSTKDIFWITSALMEDSEDLVQKGYGWLLKNASKKHEQEVFDFVMKNKHKMPRTALRYSIEKMSVDRKKQAMTK